MLSGQSRCRRTARFWRADISRSIGGQTRNLFARLTNDTAALQNLAVTPNHRYLDAGRLKRAIQRALPLSLQPTM